MQLLVHSTLKKRMVFLYIPRTMTPMVLAMLYLRYQPETAYHMVFLCNIHICPNRQPELGQIPSALVTCDV